MSLTITQRRVSKFKVWNPHEDTEERSPIRALILISETKAQKIDQRSLVFNVDMLTKYHAHNKRRMPRHDQRSKRGYVRNGSVLGCYRARVKTDRGDRYTSLKHLKQKYLVDWGVAQIIKHTT